MGLSVLIWFFKTVLYPRPCDFLDLKPVKNQLADTLYRNSENHA